MTPSWRPGTGHSLAGPLSGCPDTGCGPAGPRSGRPGTGCSLAGPHRGGSASIPRAPQQSLPAQPGAGKAPCGPAPARRGPGLPWGLRGCQGDRLPGPPSVTRAAGGAPSPGENVRVPGRPTLPCPGGTLLWPCLQPPEPEPGCPPWLRPSPPCRHPGSGLRSRPQCPPWVHQVATSQPSGAADPALVALWCPPGWFHQALPALRAGVRSCQECPGRLSRGWVGSVCV